METLNYIEAHLALAEGKCVADKGGTIYKWLPDKNLLRAYWTEGSSFSRDWMIDDARSPFTIVPDPSLPAIPEKKSLSFDEARENVVDCKPMIIQEHAKEGVLYVTRKTWSVDPCMDLLMLDLADRRGLLVTEYKAPAHPIDKEG